MWLANLSAQLLGLVAFGLLSIPAFHAAEYGKLLSKAEKARPSPGSPGRKAYQTALEALNRHREKWTRWKGFCLMAGTLLTVASFGLATYVAYSAPEVK